MLLVTVKMNFFHRLHIISDLIKDTEHFIRALYNLPDNITFMLQAAVVSVVIAALALTFGLCLGILGAAGRISKNKVAHGIATFYVETIRGTPMMLQILFFYLGVPSIVRSITGNPFNPSVYLIGVVTSSMFQSIGHGLWSLCVATLRNFMRIPLCFALSFTMSLTMVWCGITMGEVIASSIVTVAGFMVLRRLRHELGDDRSV